jgi:hypothetical protein
MKTKIFSILMIIGVGAVAQNVSIPDVNFKTYLVGNAAINTNGDKEIQLTEANAYNGDIDCEGLKISDLTGIEAFVALTELYCSENSLTTLDLSKNIALIELACSENNLTSLDLSKNKALLSVDCFENSLMNLDLSHNIALTSLDCSENSLTSLNVANGNNVKMKYDFDTSKNPKLINIIVDDVVYSSENWKDIDPTSKFVANE